MASKPKQGDDDRFNRVMKDPRFWEMPERQRKIKIDKRFQAMFHDKQFKLKYTVDKRGRPINHSSTDDLKRFYDLSDSEESDHEDKKLSSKKKKVKSKAKVETEDVRHLVEQNTEKPKTKGKSKSKKEKEATCGTIKCEQLESESSTLEVSIDKLNKKSKATKDLQSIETEGCSKVEPIQEGQKIILSELKKQKAPENKKLTKLKMKDALSDEDVDGSENEGYGSIEKAESAAELSEDDEDERGQEEEEAESDEDDSDEGSDSEEESDSGPDLARGKGNIETSSEEDEEDDLTDLLRKEDDVEHDWGELWKDAPRGDTVTRRLAVCNMDWDRMKAKDLLALLNSFKPKGGVVLSVKIYPSEFGEQRMQAEQLQGPLELAALPEDPDKDTEQERIYREKMREYQFKRMKYFYAVVDCDSPETASKIYEECDGFEYESSCSFLDLRFIPDDVMFDEEPKDVAADVDLASYTPKYFTSTAMATSKVELTWDETDHERVTALSRTFKKDEILDMDFQAYLASSSEEEEEEEEMEGIVDESEQTANVDDTEQGKASRPKKAHKDDEEQMAKYRELLKSIQEKDKKREDKDMEMEIKWVPGLKETAEQLVKKKLEGKDNLTPWEMFLEKKKEKKKLKKKADVKKVSAEDLSDDELPPDVDIDDPYFAEEFGKTGIGQKKKSKKNKKSKEDERTPEEEAEIEKQKAEMSLLMMDDEDDNKKHFNYDKIVEQQNLSKKKKKKLLKQEELLEEDEFQVDVSDPRFQAMYTSHLFNLDPSEPGFKKTKATQRIVEEKMRRREAQQQSCDDAVQKKERELGEEKEPAKKTLDPGLSMLIKSIKSKTQQFQARKKLKTK